MIEKYPFAGKVVVYDNDEHGYPDYNLSILDEEGNVIWNMKEVIKRPDTCVVLRFLNDEEMYFSTFNGWHVTLNVKTMTVVETNLGK